MNSFLPIIKGKVNKGIVGTIVNVKMRLHLFVVFFMVIWFGAVLIGCLFTLSIIFSDESFDPFYLIPFVMLIFGYGITMIPFKYESNKSKKYFADLFEAEIEI